MDDESALQKKNNAFLRQIVDNILITGTEDFISEISTAIEIIKEHDPLSWKIITENLKSVIFAEHSGVDCETGCFSIKYSSEKSLEWIAGALVHDAWHVEYFKTGQPFEGEEAEKNCLLKENEFYKKAGYEPLDIEKELNKKYWEIPFEERDW